MPLWSQQFPELGKLINSGQLDQARIALQAELQKSPDNPELYYWKAALEMKGGQAAEAEKTLKSVIEKGIAQPPHFLMLADIYNSRKQWAESVQIYRQALVKQYTPRMAYNLAVAEFQLKNFKAVIEAVKPLAEHPDANWRFHHLLGLAYFGLNEFEEALPHLAKAAQSEPVQANNLYDYALALLQAQHFDEAADHFKRTIDLQPRWARAHLYLGRTLHDQNLGEDALKSFQQAERLNPNLPLLHHHYGLLYRGRGEFDQAIAEFEKEIASGADYPPSYFHLADLLFNRAEYDRSATLAARAVQLSPDNAEFRLLAAKLAIQEEDWAKAEEHIQAALVSEPASSQAYFQLGRLRQAQGHPDEAEQAFEMSRRLADQKSGRTP